MKMKIEQLQKENIQGYQSLLAEDEIPAIQSGRYMGIGIYDEAEGSAAGIMTVEILPKMVRIHRIFVAPMYRGSGIGTILLTLVERQPEKGRIPLTYVTGEANKAGEAFLGANGFRDMPFAYKVMTDRVGDVTVAPASDKIKQGLKVQSLREVAPELAEAFMARSFPGAAELPDYADNPAYFGEGSLVCLSKNRICGILPIEEREGGVLIPWVYAEDSRAVYLLVARLEEVLKERYDADDKISFWVKEGPEEEALQRILQHARTEKLRIFARMPI